MGMLTFAQRAFYGDATKEKMHAFRQVAKTNSSSRSPLVYSDNGWAYVPDGQEIFFG